MKVNRKELGKTVLIEFFRERSLMHGAALAYYAILALVPLLYLSMTFFGRIVGQDTMIDVIANLLSEQIGIKDITGILGFLEEVDLSSGNLLMEILGLLALMLSATAIINSLKRSLNDFYNLQRRGGTIKKKIVRGLLFRLASMAFIAGVTVIIVVFYFAETVFLSIGDDLFTDDSIASSIFSWLAHYGIPILTNLLIFSFIFKYLHDGKVKWRRAIEGALLTSVFLFLGQLLIKYYLINYFFAANGGVAGTILIILVWVYYSSQIIFLGAKFITVKSRFLGEELLVRD
ncbi:MAG: membrane protein [Flavobacteriaceae bacterium]|jgi:membrane protein